MSAGYANGMTKSRSRDRLVDELRELGISNEDVLERIREVPRHLFIEEALQSHAYDNAALPIGYGQTISQPFIVALMTETLIRSVRPGEQLETVLEIGTGCGYQTAVLAPFVRHVYSIERLGPLVVRARQTLRELGIHNVSLRHSDGLRGWRSAAPFNGMLVAAAPEHVPEDLLAQLGEGGKLVIPIGARARQSLLCVTRHGGRYRRAEVAPVSFVPLVAGTES